ncbi:MAG: ABC transporter ATP-binding protein [Planctomycetia bacterium]|nr:ABC transporter ATP-binding protein [Planctomycetia bacterium]
MIIDFKNVTISRNGILALADVSFTFDAEKMPSVAILGANGAGKSTLLEAIPGLRLLSGGEVTVNGLTVEKRNLTAIRKQVGLIFQNSDDQLFSQTVREDVAFGPMNLGLDAEEVESRTTDALERMGVTTLAARNVASLSGGEKRRVALAGILAMRPAVVLMDEPTSMLDPRGCRELAEYLNTLDQMKIIATHDLHFARQTCPISLILRDGRIHTVGNTEEILRDTEMLCECGLM